MKARIQKWGNSLAIRIPAALAKETRMRQGSGVEMTMEEGGIRIKPLKERGYPLAELLRGVTEKNIPGEIA
jgi:antitoxin MazE